MLGFKTRVDPFPCMLCCLCATESPDSPLVRHPLTSWWPTWQPSWFNPHTYEQALVGLESGIYLATVSQMLYQMNTTIRGDFKDHCRGLGGECSSPGVCSFCWNFTERQILWSLCSVDFHTLTLQLPIQTPHSVAPELQVCVSSLNISAKRAHPRVPTRTVTLRIIAQVSGVSVTLRGDFKNHCTDFRGESSTQSWL